MLLALAGGIAIGLLIGMLGGGGAILAVPLLIYGFHFPAHQATTASLIVVGIGALTGMMTHLRHGNVRLGQGVIFGLLGVAGSFLGSSLARGIAEPVLLTSFAALLVVVATLMIRKARRSPADTQSTTARRSDGQHWLALVAAATGVGFLTGFFGVGGGFAIVPALVMVLGYPMKQAIGTSLIVIAINSALSLGFRMSEANAIDWSVVVPILGATVAGSFAGAVLGKHVRQSTLQLGFATFLLLIAAYMAVENVPQLIG